MKKVPEDPATGAFAEGGVLAYVLLGVAVCLVLWAMRGMAAGQVSACHVLVAHVRGGRSEARLKPTATRLRRCRY